MAGLDVQGSVLVDEARDVNPEWTFAIDNGRPFVTWKFAATLDGRSAAADGTSQWITGEAALPQMWPISPPNASTIAWCPRQTPSTGTPSSA
jgi:hypothetical protein